MPKRLICGVGINDSSIPTHYFTNEGRRLVDVAYDIWRSMIRRCYHPEFKDDGYTMSEQWYSRSEFLQWLDKQDYKDKVLDCSLLKIGGKVYSPETCCFVPRGITALVRPKYTDNFKSVGVLISKSGKKYRAMGYADSKGAPSYFGMYDTYAEAFKAHALTKAEHIREKALELEDLRIREGLINHAVFWEQKVLEGM